MNSVYRGNGVNLELKSKTKTNTQFFLQHVDAFREYRAMWIRSFLVIRVECSRDSNKYLISVLQPTVFFCYLMVSAVTIRGKTWFLHFLSLIRIIIEYSHYSGLCPRCARRNGSVGGLKLEREPPSLEQTLPGPTFSCKWHTHCLTRSRMQRFCVFNTKLCLQGNWHDRIRRMKCRWRMRRRKNVERKKLKTRNREKG